MNIKERILFSMLSHGYVNERHTPIENARKGFKSNERKEVKKAMKELIRDDKIVRIKKTGHGADVFIDSERVKDVVNMPGIKEELNKNCFMKERFKKYL